MSCGVAAIADPVSTKANALNPRIAPQVLIVFILTPFHFTIIDFLNEVPVFVLTFLQTIKSTDQVGPKVLHPENLVGVVHPHLPECS